MVAVVSRQHEQMKSRTLAIANIRIAQGSTDVRETTSAYARGQPGWAGGQQMMSTKIMNLSQVVNQGLCETALSAEHERPVSWWALHGCCYFLVGSGWFLLFPGGLWMVAVISWRALDGCCYFLVGSG